MNNPDVINIYIEKIMKTIKGKVNKNKASLIIRSIYTPLMFYILILSCGANLYKGEFMFL